MLTRTAFLSLIVFAAGCQPNGPGYREFDARVTSLQWERSVELQKRVLKHGESWRHEMPAGAMNLRCESRQNGVYDCNPYACGYDTIAYPCGGYECGCYEVCDEYDCWEECDWCEDTCYSTETRYCYDLCPKYEDWCRYDYEEWQVIDQKVESGAGHDAVWPSLTAGAGERVVQYEDYWVAFGTNKATYDYWTESYSDYTRFNLGAIWRIRVGSDGAVEPLNPAAK